MFLLDGHKTSFWWTPKVSCFLPPRTLSRSYQWIFFRQLWIAKCYGLELNFKYSTQQGENCQSPLKLAALYCWELWLWTSLVRLRNPSRMSSWRDWLLMKRWGGLDNWSMMIQHFVTCQMTSRPIWLPGLANGVIFHAARPQAPSGQQRPEVAQLHGDQPAVGPKRRGGGTQVSVPKVGTPEPKRTQVGAIPKTVFVKLFYEWSCSAKIRADCSLWEQGWQEHLVLSIFAQPVVLC